jgi:hypothetical protein
VPTDETAQPLDPSQLPESLRPDFTTTTTTTTVAPPTTLTFTVYLLNTDPDTDRRVVVPVTRDLPRGASIADVLGSIFGQEVRTDEERDAAYSNALFELDLLGATFADGIVTVDVVPLDPEGEPSTEVFTGDLLGAAAQIVFSATELEDVTGVVILFNGEPVEIPTSRGDAELGAVLDRGLYERFDPSVTEPETTTTTVATETVPAETVPTEG